ncbi:MAG: hypothetical protein ACP5NI_11085, partial [Acetobacteraceae bacterium]
MHKARPEPRETAENPVLPLDLPPLSPPRPPAERSAATERREQVALLRHAIARGAREAPARAEAALRAFPADAELLLLAALAAVRAGEGARALAYLKRFRKRYEEEKPAALLEALALAEQGQIARARALLESAGLANPGAAAGWFVGEDGMLPWLHLRLDAIHARAAPARPGPPRAPVRAPARGRAV